MIKMDSIVIFSAKIARDLIRQGYKLDDISSDKNIKIKTIFYFENTEKLKDYLKQRWNIDIK